MTTYDVFPDAEALVRKALDDAMSCGVYSSVPKNPTYPLITVLRYAGAPTERHRLDVAGLQIDVWGNSQSEAQDLAQQARVTIHEMEGNSFTDPVSGFVSGVTDALGLRRLTDPLTARDRYVFSVWIYLHS